MKLNNRFIFGILSLVLAAVIAFVALPTIARQTNGKTEIVRITQPVLKGETITSDNAEVVEVGGYNLPSNVAHSMEDVEGLYVTADLAAGDYILTSKVSTVPVSSDVALNDIPSGKVAISLTVKTLASGLSDKLQPGDIIRIYHFLETAEEVPELRFVKVLSVTDSDGINVDNTKEPTEDEEPQQSATITVLASPEQARISIITTSYLRTEDLIRAVKENLPYINEPVKANFEAFVYEAELINANLTSAINSLKMKVPNRVFHEWCNILIQMLLVAGGCAAQIPDGGQ